MNLYWLSRGGAAAEGPFAEEQLLGMWRAGAVTARDQVCLEGTDEWEEMTSFVAVAESFQAAAPRARSTAERLAAYEATRPPAKSEGVALALSFLLTGFGHVYAGEVWQGLVVFVLAVLLATAGVWPLALIIWIAVLVDSPRAVRRWNKKR